MGKKSFKNQKIYKMKGCSKRKSRRRLGGSQLAYTGEQPIQTGPNPKMCRYVWLQGEVSLSCINPHASTSV